MKKQTSVGQMEPALEVLIFVKVVVAQAKLHLLQHKVLRTASYGRKNLICGLTCRAKETDEQQSVKLQQPENFVLRLN